MNRLPNTKTKYNNSDITVIAVFQLGGALRYIHLEDIAVKAAELSPKAFSWKKYPERINLETVRIALKRELEAKARRVYGSIRHGWMLTPRGLLWCLESTGTEANRSPLEQIQKEIARIKKNDNFSKVTAGRSADLADDNLKALLRIDEYFSPRSRSERILAVANAAVIDPQLNPVLNYLRQRGFTDSEVEL
jgi:hypothetical protein